MSSPGARIWAVDVNERARDLCTANTADRSNVNVVAPEAVPEAVRFTEIWSNPPVRIGKEALHELLTGWLGRLLPDGRAHLVVSRHLGADSLQRWLSDQGWILDRRGSRRGYRLLSLSVRSPSDSDADRVDGDA